MKKINIKSILQVIKDIIKNGCVIFTAILFFIGTIGYLLAIPSEFTTEAVFMSFAYGVIIAAAYKVFSIKILPKISQHILFFALVYIGFMFVYMPTVNKNMTPQTTLYLTIAYVVVYLLCFGVVQFIKFLIRRRREKKQDYETQFKNTKV